MNWTGGRLQNHSHAASSAKHRQKQHFAKVQHSRGTGSKKPSPIKWQIFGLATGDLGHDSQLSRAPRQQSRALEQDGRLSGLSHHSDLQQRDTLCSAHHVPKAYHGIPIKWEDTHDDELYIASPLPCAKRKRGASLQASDRASPGSQNTPKDPLLEKRKKVLERWDWVGMNIQKPIHLAFAVPKHEEQIGRRRTVPGTQRARFRKDYTHITSPFPTRKEVREPERRQFLKGDVRISIGGKEVPPGISSSSMHRSGSHPDMKHRSSQTISSDVMLLDRDHTGIQGTSSAKVTPRSNIPQSGPSILHVPSHSDIFRSSKEHTESGLLPLSKTPEIDQQRQKISSHAQKKLNRYSDIESDYQPLEQNSVDPIPTRLHTPELHQSRRERGHGPLVFSSSSTSIHHPKPQSSRISVLLRSGSADTADSNIVHVGAIKPTGPSSQILDNEIWRSWIAHESDGIEFQDVTLPRLRKEGHKSRYISPGVSMAPRNDNRAPGEDEDEESDIQTDEPGAALSEHSLHNPLSRSSSQAFLDLLRRQGKYDFSLNPSATPAILSLHPQRSRNFKDTALLPTVYTNHLNGVVPKPIDMALDADDIWRTFVFGSDSNDDDTEKHAEHDRRVSGQYPDLTRQPKIVHRVIASSSLSPVNNTTGATQCTEEQESIEHDNQYHPFSSGAESMRFDQSSPHITQASLVAQVASEYGSGFSR